MQESKRLGNWMRLWGGKNDVCSLASRAHRSLQLWQRIRLICGRYRQLGLDIYSRDGYLFAHLTALRQASQNSAIPRDLKDQLNASLHRCKNSQNEAIIELMKYDVEKSSSGWTFFWKSASLKKKYERFKSDLDELDKICQRLAFLQQFNSNLLRPDFFKLIHENDQHQPGQLLPISDIWVAAGNHAAPDARQSGDFVLEKKYVENDVQSLCNILRSASVDSASHAAQGILPCLGYRQPLYNDSAPPYRSFLQLIMVLPPEDTWQSLAYVLDTKTAPELSRRVDFTKALASAVTSVHSLGLVHKSIRSRAILLSTGKSDPACFPKLFLQDWTYVREQNGATSQNGAEGAWQRRLYEHPERQRSFNHFPETAYEPKHDIYSLGVVIMEILLWKPFVERCDHSNLTSELKVAGLYEDLALGLGESVIPQRYAGNSIKLTQSPVVIKEIWMQVAKRDLSGIDADLKDIVVKCLESQFVRAQEVLDALEKVKI
jgi:hypothetical protein